MRAFVLAFVLVAAVTPPARAQVVAHPNQIRGSFTITNVNPEIVSALADPRTGLQSFAVNGTSVSLAPPLSARTDGAIDDPQHGHYELTVEAGVPGIAYSVLSPGTCTARPDSRSRPRRRSSPSRRPMRRSTSTSASVSSRCDSWIPKASPSSARMPR